MNEGKIETKRGNIFLFAHRIENQGKICGNEVWVGAGHEILFAVEGNDLLLIKPELGGDGILNEGKIEAVKILLSSYSNPYELGVKNIGSIEANHLEQKDGEIYLSCRGANFQNHGSLKADQGQIYLELENSRGENMGKIKASQGEISIISFVESSNLADHKPFLNQGIIDASGDQAGSISISTPKFENGGVITSMGEKGKIQIFVPGKYIEWMSASMSVNGENGLIKVLAGDYFSSARLEAKGRIGGKIDIEADTIVYAAATLDVSGQKFGGNLSLQANSCEFPIILNNTVKINASGVLKGGRVRLMSPLPIHSQGSIRIDGIEDGELDLPSMKLEENRPVSLANPTPNQEILQLASCMESRPTTSFWKIWEKEPFDKNPLEPNETLHPACKGDPRPLLIDADVIFFSPNEEYFETVAETNCFIGSNKSLSLQNPCLTETIELVSCNTCNGDVEIFNVLPPIIEDIPTPVVPPLDFTHVNFCLCNTTADFFSAANDLSQRSGDLKKPIDEVAILVKFHSPLQSITENEKEATFQQQSNDK